MRSSSVRRPIFLLVRLSLAREAVNQEGTLFVVNEISAQKYEKLGPEHVNPLFADTGTQGGET